MLRLLRLMKKVFMRKLTASFALVVFFSGPRMPVFFHAVGHVFERAHRHQHDGHAHNHEHKDDRNGHHHEIAEFLSVSSIAPQSFKIEKPEDKFQNVSGDSFFLNRKNPVQHSVRLGGIGPPDNRHAFLLDSPPTGRAPPA